MPRTERLALLAALAAGLIDPAFACTVSATSVAFGTYDTLTPAPDDSTGSIQLVCHPNVHAPVVSLGTGAAGTYSPRHMTGATDLLPYNLYTSAARSVIWGDGTGGSATVTLTTSIVNRGIRTYDQPIHGRIPAQQVVDSGAYSDTLFVTVTF